ncbi:1-phosphatidylinositol 4,5-bisphosphate phosphodiesterase gamma-1-like, partial [Rhincodon typus]
WKGDYGGKRQLWFPANYVEEIMSPSTAEPERLPLNENSPLGDLLGGSLDVPSCQIAIHPDGKGSRPYVFKINVSSFNRAGQTMDLAAETQEDMNDWVAKIREAAQTADAR